MGRNLNRLYNNPGQVLHEENFNEIINILTGLETVSTNLSLDSDGLGVGTYQNSDFSITRDANNDITGVSLNIHEFSNTPLYTTDNLTYSNTDITNPITSSTYVILDENGNTVDSTTYTLNADGSITFSASQTAEYFIMKDMEYVKKKTLTIGRDANGLPTTFDIS